MYIKDLETGITRKYGENTHDSLNISADGKTLTYENLQNGDGSLGGYRFTDEDGNTPEEAAEKTGIPEAIINSYFNIGGF